MARMIRYMDAVKGNGIQVISGEMVERIKPKTQTAGLFDNRLSKNRTGTQEKKSDRITLTGEAMGELKKQRKVRFLTDWIKRYREKAEGPAVIGRPLNGRHDTAEVSDEAAEAVEMETAEKAAPAPLNWDELLMNNCSLLMTEISSGKRPQAMANSFAFCSPATPMPGKTEPLPGGSLGKLMSDYRTAMKSGVNIDDKTAHMVKTTLIMAGARIEEN